MSRRKGQGNPLRAAGGIGDGQRSEHRFGWFNLSDSQQQAGVINPFASEPGCRPAGYLASATGRSPER